MVRRLVFDEPGPQKKSQEQTIIASLSEGLDP